MAQPLTLKRDDRMDHKSEHFDNDKPDTLNTHHTIHPTLEKAEAPNQKSLALEPGWTTLPINSKVHIKNC